MPGPPPKPPGQRRRRNKPAEPAAVLPETSGLEAPELPFAESANPFTVRWWAALWASPMAAEYVPMDELQLVMLAQLVDRVANGSASKGDMEEMRQMADRFGLSPLSRLRLGWKIGKGERGEKSPADPPANVTDMKAFRSRLK